MLPLVSWYDITWYMVEALVEKHNYKEWRFEVTEMINTRTLHYSPTQAARAEAKHHGETSQFHSGAFSRPKAGMGRALLRSELLFRYIHLSALTSRAKYSRIYKSAEHSPYFIIQHD